MSKNKDIFEKIIRAESEDVPLSELKKRFSGSAQEFAEAERLFAVLRGAKDEATPSKDAFRKTLAAIAGTPASRPALVSARQFSWRMVVPALAFAAVAFAFLNLQSGTPKDTAALPSTPTVETQSDAAWTDLNKTGKTPAALPSASGNAEDIVAAMFAQMEEENAALSSQMDEAASSTARDSKALDEITYDENQI